MEAVSISRADNDNYNNSGVCLICHTKAPSEKPTKNSYFHPSNPQLLLKDLQSYFLLKHILDIPVEQLQGYLQHCPTPGDWVVVCSVCTDMYVDKCTRIFFELLEVKRKYRSARNKVIEAVKESVKWEPDCEADPFTVDISSQVRRFVANIRDKVEVCVDPSVEDSMASKFSTLEHHQSSRNIPVFSVPSGEITSRIVVEDVKEELPDPDTESSDNSNSRDEDDDWDEHNENLSVEKSMEEDEPMAGERGRTSCKLTGTDRIVKKAGIKAASSNRGKRLPKLSEYKCDECPKIFASYLRLYRHKRGCHGEQFHVCKEAGCGYKSRMLQYVKIHARRHHGTTEDLQKLTCSTCNKVFSKPSHLNYHMSLRHNTTPNFKCDFCEKTFADHVSLKSHLADIHDVKEYQRYPCKFDNCSRAFYQKSFLVTHEATHQTPEIHLCHICTRTCKSVKLLQNHLKTHGKSEEHEAPDLTLPKGTTKMKKSSTQPSRVKNGKANANGDLHKCPDPECDYKTRRPGFLKPHVMRYHGTDAEFQGLSCPTCHKKLANLSSLLAHIPRRHNCTTDKTTFKCDFCERISINESDLQAHLAGAHTLKEFHRYPCTFSDCNQVYYQKCLLDYHLWSHLTKAYQCFICNREVSSLFRLDLHLKNHSIPQKTKILLRCDRCPATYSVRGNLRKHKIIKHGVEATAEQDANEEKIQVTCNYQSVGCGGKLRYPCQQEGCSKVLSSYHIYKLHQKLVHSSQLHLCSTCGKGFKHRLYLRKHVRGVHERPAKKGFYKCQQCDMVYTYNYRLELHVKRVHLKLKETSHFFCEICGKSTSTASNLKLHRAQAHFICSLNDCGLKCGSLQEIWSHQKTVHGKETIAWECDQCGKLLLQKSKLKIHKQLHQIQRRRQEDGEGTTTGGEWVCDVCGKKFALKQYLYYHNWHTHKKLRRNKSRRTGRKGVGVEAQM